MDAQSDRLRMSAKIRERRALAHKDASAIALNMNMDEAETKRFLSSADSNAIWDAQQNLPYRTPVPPKPVEPVGPMYSELGFLSDTQQRKLFSGK
jgi:hypothetical protein